jgi:hypothetical protein
LVAWLIGRRGPVTFGDQIRATLHALPIALGVLAACLVATKLTTDARWQNGAMTLVVLISAGLGGGLAGGLSIRTTRRVLMDFLEQIPLWDRIKVRK